MSIETIDNLTEVSGNLRKAYFIYNQLRDFLGLHEVEVSEESKMNFLLYRDSLDSMFEILSDYIDLSKRIIDKEVADGIRDKDKQSDVQI